MAKLPKSKKSLKFPTPAPQKKSPESSGKPSRSQLATVSPQRPLYIVHVRTGQTPDVIECHSLSATLAYLRKAEEGFVLVFTGERHFISKGQGKGRLKYLVSADRQESYPLFELPDPAAVEIDEYGQLDDLYDLVDEDDEEEEATEPEDLPPMGEDEEGLGDFRVIGEEAADDD